LKLPALGLGLNDEAFTLNLDPGAVKEDTDPVGLTGTLPKLVAFALDDVAPFELTLFTKLPASVGGARLLLGSNAGIFWITIPGFFDVSSALVVEEGPAVEFDVTWVTVVVGGFVEGTLFAALLLGPLKLGMGWMTILVRPAFVEGVAPTATLLGVRPVVVTAAAGTFETGIVGGP